MSDRPDAGLSSALLSDLSRRGLLEQCTHMEELDQHFSTGQRTIYCGFDPTADSLHIGSLVPLLAMRRVQLAGHRPLLLVGGGTGLIGDPSGKAQERTLNEAETVSAWSERLRQQVSRFVDLDDKQNEAIVANNYDWLGSLSVIGFMRDIGKYFSVNNMMAKESIRARLEREDVGISYTEFSYCILQAVDFYKLYQKHDCTVQIGGSDQWGNIVSGIDLTRRLEQAQLYGVTLPLLVKSDGTKFGKTESGTIWLDADKTSPYAFYQFWINQADDDVDRLLRFFTFIDCDEIDNIVAEHSQNPGLRMAQLKLAEAVTRIVHGDEGVACAERITAALFGGDVRDLLPEDVKYLERDGLPSHVIEDDSVDLAEALVNSGLAKSKRQAREFISNGAVTVNSERVEDAEYLLERGLALHGRYFVVRRGKKNYALLCLR